jgi:predicted DNA-binding transcriptional regulator YafY
MANTSARMLRLLSLLQTHRYWPGTELAERLEVSERTLRRDIDRLRDLGYPVDASRGVAGGYQLRSGAAMPPLLLDDEEAVAIAAGLRAAAGLTGIEEISVRALTKVIAVMPARLRRRVDALRSHAAPASFGGGPTIDPGVLTLLAQACRDDERLRFDYISREGDATPRHVEPNHLVCLRRHWYLLAWDLERHDWRTFRVDRLTEPRSTGARFRQRALPGGDPAVFVRDRIAPAATRFEVEVIVHLPAEDARRVVAHTGGTVEFVDAGSCLLRMTTDDLNWPTFALGAMNARFDIVSPPELGAFVHDLGQRLLDAGVVSAR